eukprot:5066318-Amphidinium_carterae.1
MHKSSIYLDSVLPPRPSQNISHLSPDAEEEGFTMDDDQASPPSPQTPTEAQWIDFFLAVCMDQQVEMLSLLRKPHAPAKPSSAVRDSKPLTAPVVKPKAISC